MVDDIRKEIISHADEKRARVRKWFFKTKKGEYGYGDKFLGISIPIQRKIAKKFKDLPLPDVENLLSSQAHEERLIALFILVDKFKKETQKIRKEIFDFYLKSTKFINNWDLVDSSAYKIVGEQLINYKDDELLKRLAKSKSIWERRIAMVATYQFIVKGNSATTYEIAHLLLNDNNDLIQKAVGWMLREAGKRVSESELIDFLNVNYKKMPRTMLRYAIERLPNETRKKYLKGEI